ncbi:MAG: hypothetical protein HN844_05035 [Planctomycetes bacterium]|jgi:hypothetical protein|nr:hypothetical protein [Planctomycetota bacterium]MBT4560537.1 hypothetical protein [Planctomycetota bacterium]MBT5100550.1 hypothetical protein [Planctomycetota bacterium]MBT7318568.1 hypothetical protein [Planctomycetota bacterium]
MLWKIVFVAFFVVTSVTAQNARTPQLLDATASTPSGQPVLATRGDLSALAFVDGSPSAGQSVKVAISDARGIDWAVPIRIDSDFGQSSKFLKNTSIRILQSHIYVAWADERHGNQEIYFNCSYDAGATWVGERRMNPGFALGQATVKDWSMEVEPDELNLNESLYFAFATRRPGSTESSLYFIASHDNAVSFSNPIHLPRGFAEGLNDIQNVIVAGYAYGPIVYIAWQDNRNLGGAQYDVWFQVSQDGGQTWNSADQQLNGVDGAANDLLSMSISGSRALVAWTDSRIHPQFRELRICWTGDFGLSWEEFDKKLGEAAIGTADVSDIFVMLNRQNRTVAWIDDRSGVPEVYIAANPPLSTTPWTEYLLSDTGASVLENTGHRKQMAVGWQDLSNPSQVKLALSRDAGQTWSHDSVRLSDPTTSAFGAQIEYTKLQHNFFAAWVSPNPQTGTGRVWVGGARHQTLTPLGTFQQGAPIGFAVENFPDYDSGWPFAVLVSGGSGHALLPAFDRRDTGLANDGYLAQSYSLIPGPLSGVIDDNGNGMTATLSLPSSIPAFTRLYCMAVSWDTAFGDVLGASTDPVSFVVIP